MYTGYKLANMPKYKLTYFDGRGRGECPRILFNAAGVKFEDNRIPFPEWGNHKSKTPFGSLPILEVDGKEVLVITQFQTICRFLGNEFGLTGSNNIEKAKVDEAAEYLHEMMLDIVNICFGSGTKEEKDELKKKFEESAFSKHEKKINTIFDRNKTGSGFLIGSKPTVADYLLFSIYQIVPPGALDVPCNGAMKTCYDKIADVPKIVNYCKNVQK